MMTGCGPSRSGCTTKVVVAPSRVLMSSWRSIMDSSLFALFSLLRALVRPLPDLDVSGRRHGPGKSFQDARQPPGRLGGWAGEVIPHDELTRIAVGEMGRASRILPDQNLQRQVEAG